MANRPLLAVTGLAASSVLLGASITGCNSNSSSTASSSSSASSSSRSSAAACASAEPSDYSGLLIKATDINVPNDSFTAMPTTPNPGGQPGISWSWPTNQGPPRRFKVQRQRSATT
jgi:hypothetical protein